MSQDLQPKKHEQPEDYNMRSVVKKLENYMDKVTDKECTPATVQAAVNCADKIVDIFRLHLEVERLKVKRGI
jgi:hypothetical protein